jgi:flagellar biosynthetic protein FliR
MPAELFDYFSLFRLGSVALRVSSMLVFLPLPGYKNLPTPARVLLALALAVVLVTASPDQIISSGLNDDFLIRTLADVFTGVSISLVAVLVVESFMFGGQIMAVLAGFSYASTIDPFSESDAGIMPSLMSVTANLLFFQSPLYPGLIRALAAGLNRAPENVSAGSSEAARMIVGFSSHCLDVGTKIALPVVALLFLADLFIGLFGRLQPQLHILSISFSLKLLVLMAAAAAVQPALGWLYQRLTLTAVGVVHALTR